MYTLLESTLPLRIMEILCLDSVQFGLVFMPYPVFFLVITTVTGRLWLKVKRYVYPIAVFEPEEIPASPRKERVGNKLSLHCLLSNWENRFIKNIWGRVLVPL